MVILSVEPMVASSSVSNSCMFSKFSIQWLFCQAATNLGKCTVRQNDSASNAGKWISFDWNRFVARFAVILRPNTDSMASQFSELEAVLTAIEGKPTTANLRVFGHPYSVQASEVEALGKKIHATKDFAAEWKGLLAELKAGLKKPDSAIADAKLVVLYSYYVVAARKTAESGNFFPDEMMTWLGDEENEMPAENPTWFLIGTEDVGSEAARDLVNVLGLELVFLQSFLGEATNPEALEQAGIFLARLLHHESKWPDYFKWMQLKARTKSVLELFLLGGPDMPIIRGKGKSARISDELVGVYDILSKSMYQLPFFVRLKDYSTALKKHKGSLTPEVLAIQKELLAY